MKKLVGQDKDCLLGEGRRAQGQVMPRQSLTTSHKQSDVQPLGSSHLRKYLLVLLSQLSLLNMMLHGSEYLFGQLAQQCPPPNLLVKPILLVRESGKGAGAGKRETLDVVQELFSNS